MEKLTYPNNLCSLDQDPKLGIEYYKMLAKRFKQKIVSKRSCRECQGDLNKSYLCQEHFDDLVSNMSNNTDIDIIKMVHHNDKDIEKLWRDFVIDGLDNNNDRGISGDRQSFIDCGYNDEPFERFVIDSFWHSYGIDVSESNKLTIDQFNKRKVSN